MSAATISKPDIFSVAINRLFDLRAMSLAARGMVMEDADEEDGANAGRVMKQVADLAYDLIQQIDKASLASAAGRRQDDASEKVDTQPSPDPDAGEPESLHDLAMYLSGELAYLGDYLELAEDQANQGEDGKMVSLIDAAMPRVKRAKELAEQLEIGACHK